MLRYVSLVQALVKHTDNILLKRS